MKIVIKYYLSGLTFCFCHFALNGQQSKIDSILTLLKKDKPDTNKVIHTNDLCWEYQNIGKYDISLQYGKVALDLALQLNFNQGIVASYGNIGVLYMEQGDYPKALEYYFKGLKIAEKFGNKKGIARNIGNIGSVYMQQGDYPKALEYYFKVLKTFEEIGDKGQISTILGNIGIGYWYQGDYPKALEYYFKALKMHDELGNKNRIATDYGNIGSVYHAQKDYPKALEYYFKALKMSEEIEDEGKITIWLNNIGSLYTTLKKYDEAEKYLLKSLSIAEQISSLDDVKLSHQHLSELYEALGKLAKELFHYKKYITTRDSIFNNENIKKTVQAQMNYEFDKKEAITKAENEKQQTVAAEKNRVQKIISASVAFGLLLVLVFAGFIFRSLKITRKQKQIIEIKNKETELQKKIIEEANKDITDSIKYAKRIQDVLMGEKEHKSTHLPEHFILFMPKDIVSGDFYWGFEKTVKAPPCLPNREESQSTSQITGIAGNSSSPLGRLGGASVYWYFAAVDCTGHGVPGAVMSMLGISFLNDIVSSEALLSPAEILNRLRDKVVKELRQTGEAGGSKDGMDISLCRLNLKTNELQWAGANNALNLIRKGKLEEYKADKQPIGYYPEQHAFSNHEIQLQKGDSIYIHSDGYADQFGGPNGKKFKYKQLEDLIIANMHLPMNDQKEILKQRFVEWKGALEQIDDVCVFGVRI